MPMDIQPQRYWVQVEPGMWAYYLFRENAELVAARLGVGVFDGPRPPMSETKNDGKSRRVEELEAALRKIAGAPHGLCPPKYDIEWATKESTIDVAAEALGITKNEQDAV